MTEGLLFGSGAGTRTDYSGAGISTRTPTSSRGSIGVVLLRNLIRTLLASPASQKAAWRQWIVDFLMKVRSSESAIDELLLLCTTEGGPDGLDTAIDILAKTGEMVLEYAWEYLQRDLAHWTPASDRAYKPNDDYWYILLRAVGRTATDPKERYRFITCCLHAQSRGIREGVVEGLRDLATPMAKRTLQQLAQTDGDRYIKEIAAEALADLES